MGFQKEALDRPNDQTAYPLTGNDLRYGACPDMWACTY
jgi:hypothetical protein